MTIVVDEINLGVQEGLAVDANVLNGSDEFIDQETCFATLWSGDGTGADLLAVYVNPVFGTFLTPGLVKGNEMPLAIVDIASGQHMAFARSGVTKSKAPLAVFLA